MQYRVFATISRSRYILEEAAEAGRSVRVICTQPRRISAIGVAERVAAERGERVGSGAVGYAVRGESKQGDDTCLLFCTTGNNAPLKPRMVDTHSWPTGYTDIATSTNTH